MNSDISQLLKDTICSTFEINLSKDISLVNTSKATDESIKELNLVLIDSSFSFDTITINIKFLVPAYTSSYIFNTMMMEENEPALEVDNDIADAIKEVISQISGGFETAINGASFEDLGNTKFSISDFEIKNGSEYSLLNSLSLFKFLIDEKEFELYVELEDNALPYFKNLTNDNESKSTNDEDIDIDGLEIDGLEEDLEELSLEIDDDEITLEDATEDIITDTKESVSSDLENKNIEEEIDDGDEHKNKKIKLLIIIIAGLLFTILFSVTIAYFMGVFDPEPIVVQDLNKTKKSKKSLIIVNIKNKQIDFKTDMINIKRLNKKLSILTKYEILEEDNLMKLRQDEKDRLYKLKMKRLEEFASKNAEEILFVKNTNPTNTKQANRFLNKNNKIKNLNEQIIYENEELLFIQITSLKYKKYKNIIDGEKPISIRTSICQNKLGKVDVYIGPIYLKLVSNNIMNKINISSGKKQKDVKLVVLTKKEFDKRCDF